MYKYKYIGEDEKHLPSLGITVSYNGQIVTSDTPIDHPEFVLVVDEPEVPVKKTKEL